jgi:hypothetical protein
MLTKTDIEKYFIAEKQQGLFFICIGILAIVVALLGLFLWKTQFWKGASIPLIAIAILQIIIGYTVYAKSDADRVKVVYAIDMNPDDLASKELPRLEQIMKKFITYRYIEIVLLVIGGILIYKGRNEDNQQFIYGIGVALAIQTLIILNADRFAEKRAFNYMQQIKETVK